MFPFRKTMYENLEWISSPACGVEKLAIVNTVLMKTALQQ